MASQKGFLQFLMPLISAAPTIFNAVSSVVGAFTGKGLNDGETEVTTIAEDTQMQNIVRNDPDLQKTFNIVSQPQKSLKKNASNYVLVSDTYNAPDVPNSNVIQLRGFQDQLLLLIDRIKAKRPQVQAKKKDAKGLVETAKNSIFRIGVAVPPDGYILGLLLNQSGLDSRYDNGVYSCTYRGKTFEVVLLSSADDAPTGVDEVLSSTEGTGKRKIKTQSDLDEFLESDFDTGSSSKPKDAKTKRKIVRLGVPRYDAAWLQIMKWGEVDSDGKVRFRVDLPGETVFFVYDDEYHDAKLNVPKQKGLWGWVNTAFDVMNAVNEGIKVFRKKGLYPTEAAGTLEPESEGEDQEDDGEMRSSQSRGRKNSPSKNGQ